MTRLSSTLNMRRRTTHRHDASLDLENPNATRIIKLSQPRSWKKLAAFAVGATLLIITLLGCRMSPSMSARRRMPAHELIGALELFINKDGNSKLSPTTLDGWMTRVNHKDWADYRIKLFKKMEENEKEYPFATAELQFNELHGYLVEIDAEEINDILDIINRTDYYHNAKFTLRTWIKEVTELTQYQDELIKLNIRKWNGGTLSGSGGRVYAECQEIDGTDLSKYLRAIQHRKDEDSEETETPQDNYINMFATLKGQVINEKKQKLQAIDWAMMYPEFFRLMFDREFHNSVTDLVVEAEGLESLLTREDSKSSGKKQFRGKYVLNPRKTAKDIVVYSHDDDERKTVLTFDFTRTENNDPCEVSLSCLEDWDIGRNAYEIMWFQPIDAQPTVFDWAACGGWHDRWNDDINKRTVCDGTEKTVLTRRISVKVGLKEV